MKILITGASGFIGETLRTHFESCADYDVIAISKSASNNTIGIGPIDGDTNWSQYLYNVDCVIHCAGIAHNKYSSQTSDSDIYSITNVDATSNLLKQAISNNVKRFIFLSSIGVNGCFTPNNKEFSETDTPSPYNLYTKSKLSAENSIIELCDNSTMNYIIIRLPLVYGPNPVGNLSNLLNLLRKYPLLPLAGISNNRSFLAISNLVSFIQLCTDFERSAPASNQIFLLADDEKISTTNFIRKIINAYNLNVILVKFPKFVLFLMFYTIGKLDDYKRLTYSLTVNIDKSKKLLGWTPPYNSDEQLKIMADRD